MKVYCIGNPNFIDDLSGEGGRRYAGRWNKKGTPILYTAKHSSLAILEYLGHIQISRETGYIILELEINAKQILPLEAVTPQLPENWFHQEGVSLTRQIGTDWVNSKQSAILKVPSVHTPFEHNYLINPTYPDIKLKVLQKQWYIYDNRFLRV
jgi:RES domain-containing protein